MGMRFVEVLQIDIGDKGVVMLVFDDGMCVMVLLGSYVVLLCVCVFVCVGLIDVCVYVKQGEVEFNVLFRKIGVGWYEIFMLVLVIGVCGMCFCVQVSDVVLMSFVFEGEVVMCVGCQKQVVKVGFGVQVLVGYFKCVVLFVVFKFDVIFQFVQMLCLCVMWQFVKGVVGY